MAKGKIVSIVNAHPFNVNGGIGEQGNVKVSFIVYCMREDGDPKHADTGVCYPCYENIPFEPVIDVQNGTKPNSWVKFDFNLMGNPAVLSATNFVQILGSEYDKIHRDLFPDLYLNRQDL